MFLWNLLIAILWASLSGELSLLNLLIGFALGFGALSWVRSAAGHPRYAIRLLNVLRLVALLAWELLVSTLRVAYDVITPRHRSRPGIIGFTLDARTDAEITIVATVISFMPGTLCLNLSEDRRTLFIHAMFLEDKVLLSGRLKARIERPLLEVLRR
jgi:multicomponent Na+:H+ antiporter subunit E